MVISFNYLGKLGQLGNQMFQYAATLGIARKLGVSFMIPNHDEVFVDPSSNRLRIELFDCFDIKPDSIGCLKTNNVLAEKGFEFNNNILNVDHRFNFTLHGFFSN